MEEIIKFLEENPTFYLATVDGDQPHVRPFGVIFEIDGKLNIVTNSKKAVYKQLIDNPKFELASTAEDGTFLRIWGEAFRNSTDANKNYFLEKAPTLEPFYGGDNFPFMEIFGLDKAIAEFQTLDAKRRRVEL